MADIRMPDGTLIKGVPDGVSKDDFNSHLVKVYGQDRFDAMVGTTKDPSTSDWGQSVIDAKKSDGGAGAEQAVLDASRPRNEEQANAQVAKRKQLAADQNEELQQYAAEITVERQQTGELPSYSGGALGLGKRKATQEEIATNDMALKRRLVELDIYEPERYKFTEEEFDSLTEDRIQKAMLARQGPPETDQHKRDKTQYAALMFDNPILAKSTYPDIHREETELTPEEKEYSDEAGYGRLTREVLKALPGQVWLGAKNISQMHDRLDAQNLNMGQIYLEKIASDYEDDEVGEDAKKIVEQAAATYGLSTEDYAKFTANAVDAAFEAEMGTLEEFAKVARHVQSFRPKSADDTFLGHIAAMAIENISNVAYIGAGVLTMNPMTTMALMGTDVYSRTYMNARLDGRSASNSVMDAMASTIIEAATEAVPVSKFISLRRAGRTSKSMKLLQGVGTEAAQEELAEMAQIVYDWGMLDEEMTFGGVVSRLRDAGILGGLMGAVVGGPVAVFSDNDMQNAHDRVSAAKKKLQSVATRVMDPSNKGTDATRAEAKEANKEYMAALKAKRKLVAEKIAAKAEKKKAKVVKKETKRKAKLTTDQRKRETAQETQQTADQTLTEAVTDADLEQATVLERAMEGELEADDASALQELLDAGYMKVTKAGTPVVLPAGKARAEAIRKAQEGVSAPVGDEVVQPTPYDTPDAQKRAQKRSEAVDTEIGARMRGEPVPEVVPAVEPTPYTSPAARKKAIAAKVRKGEADAADKIADAIIKAEDETQAYADQQAREDTRIDENMKVSYDQRVQEQNAVEAEVALNLSKMDQRSQSGYTGTRLGDVFRAVEKRLKKEADKARASMDKKFWEGPVQGELFDVTGVLVKGSSEYAKAVKVGAFKLAQHGAKYSAWAADMIGEFGQSIGPILAKIYHDAKKNVANVLKWSHEKFDKGSRKGELKYAPKKYSKPGALRSLRNTLRKLAKEGAEGKYWYERTGKAIKRITGNMKEARKLAGLLAIYSSGTAVGANLTNALKMWAIYQGHPDIGQSKSGTLAGRWGEQDRTALEWLRSDASDEHFVQSFGDKRFPFFTNIMREVDPETYEFGQGVTIDMWIMRALGYDRITPTTAQFAFGAVEMRMLADKLGWERQQVQAAVWVAIKARWEYIQKKAKNRAVKEGLAEWNAGPKGKPVFDVIGVDRADQIVNEKKIIMLFREEALSASVGELTAKLDSSKRDFSDYLEDQYATISWESVPSSSLGLIFNLMPIEDKVVLQFEISQALTNPETGREYIAEWLGLLGASQYQGPGAWDGAIGAVTQNQVLVPTQHRDSVKAVKGVQVESKSAMDGYAAIMGFLLKQDAVGWHRPFYGTSLKASNGIGLPFGKMTSAKLRRTVMSLYANIIRVAIANGHTQQVGLEWAPIVIDGEIRILNFSDVPNRDFHKIISEAADNAKLKGDFEVFQTDGNLVMNDWIENPNGESYEEEINNSENARVQKAFGRAKSELVKRIESVYAKHAEKYAARTPDVQVTLVREGKKVPKLKKGRVRFRHFGKKGVQTLKVEYFGTGLRGKEKARGSRPVISAYPDKGFKKEQGLGQYEYVIDVAMNDLYNANEDHLNLKEKNRSSAGAVDMTGYENDMRAAGFVGYYVPDAQGNLKGQARFFTDLTVGSSALSATMSTPEGPVIVIRENSSDELEVMEKNGEIYYATDPDDAVNTARRIYGSNVVVEIQDEYGDVITREMPKSEPLKIQLRGFNTRMEGESEFDKAGQSDFELAIREFFDEWMEMTDSNPLSPDERVFDWGSAVTIRPDITGQQVWLDSIRSFDKTTGQGSKALKAIIDLADRHGIKLTMLAKPFETEGVGLDQETLIKWYERNGFVAEFTDQMGERSMKMTRVPQAPNTRTFSKLVPTTNEGIGIPLGVATQLAKDFMIEVGIDNVVVVKSVDQLPKRLYDQAVQFGFTGTMQGVYYDDPIRGPTIYIIANNMYKADSVKNFGKPDIVAMRKVLLHETIGHFGLQALLGIKKYNQMMDAIIRAFPNEVKRRSEGLGKGLQSQRLAAEEVFAYMVQEELYGVNLDKMRLNFIERVLTAIRELFVRLGWVEMTRNDMLNLMMRSLTFVQNNTTATIGNRARSVEAFRVAEIRAENAGLAFGPDATLSKRALRKARRDDPDLDRFLNKIGHGKGTSTLDSLRNRFESYNDNLVRALEISMFDAFAGIRHGEEDLGIFGDQSGYISVRMTAGSDVVIRSMLENGAPMWDIDGAVRTMPNSQGLIDILAKVGHTAEMLKMFEAYIVAHRAKRLSKENRENLLSREEIGAVLKYVRKNKLYKLFKETANELAEFKKQVLNFAEEAGLINKEGRKLWENHDHVPFYRVISQDKTGPMMTSRLGMGKRVVYRLKGGKDVMKKPLDSIVENLSLLIEASMKNKAMTEVVNNFLGTGIISKAPQVELATALIPMSQVKDMLNEAGVSLDQVGDQMLSGIRMLTSLVTPTANNIISIMENGQRKYYYVHDTGVMRGLDRISPTNWGYLMKLLRAPKRLITIMITRFPGFIMKNWFRDMWHAAVLQRHGQVLPVIDSARGWAKAIVEDKTYKDVLSGGGMFDAGYVNASDPDRAHKSIRKAVISHGRHNILDTPRKLAKFYMRIANGAENAHRLIVYQKTLKATGSRKQALFESRDLMDFSVRGSNVVVRFLAETVPFWGARVQGIQRTGKGFTERPWLTTARGLAISLATVALFLKNRDDERYKNLALYDRMSNYHFLDVFEPGDHYVLPKPFEIGAFFSAIPEIMTELMLSTEPDRGKQAALALRFVIEQQLSLAPEVQTVMPFAELAMNQSTFTKAPIISRYEQDIDPSFQYSNRTNRSVKAFSQSLPDYAPDFLRSPKKLEHLIKGYLATFADHALFASDFLLQKATQNPNEAPTKDWSETPFFKSFTRSSVPKYGKYINAMYENLEAANKIYNAIVKLEKEESDASDLQIEGLEDKYEDLLYSRDPLNDARKEIKKINLEIFSVEMDVNMTPEEKREELDELYKIRSEIAQDVYDDRLGGKRNTEEQVESFWDGLIGMTKEQQVDALISASLPHTATLINDMEISSDKLRSVV